MSDYDWQADARASYEAARKLQREKLLRARAWKALGPQDEEERKIVEEGE